MMPWAEDPGVWYEAVAFNLGLIIGGVRELFLGTSRALV
jgi:hypothetical protein